MRPWTALLLSQAGCGGLPGVYFLAKSRRPTQGGQALQLHKPCLYATACVIVSRILWGQPLVCRLSVFDAPCCISDPCSKATCTTNMSVPKEPL